MIFDPAIFDPAIFDTGAPSPVDPKPWYGVTVGQLVDLAPIGELARAPATAATFTGPATVGELV